MDFILGIGLITLAVVLVVGLIYKKISIDKQIEVLNELEDERLKAKLKAKEIVEKAEKEAVARCKELELKAREDLYRMKEETEKSKSELQGLQESSSELLSLREANESLKSLLGSAESKYVRVASLNSELQKKVEILEQEQIRKESVWAVERWNER